MSQVNASHEELDRFAQSLAQFNDTLNEAVNGLNHSFCVLGDTWQDEKRASFEEDYNALVQQFSHFEANVSELVPYLHTMASYLRDYLKS